MPIWQKRFFERGAVPGAAFKKQKGNPLRLAAEPLLVMIYRKTRKRFGVYLSAPCWRLGA